MLASETIRIFKLILSSKFIFKKPLKKKYLIFDLRNKDLLYRYIDKNNSNILFTRGEQINFYVFFYSLVEFGFKDLHFNYIKSYIKLTKPKFCITLNHPKIYFYKIKNYFKHITVIAIQNGHSYIFKNKFIQNLKKTKKNYNLSADYILTINRFFSQKLFKKYIKSNFVEIGSFKNNYYYKKKNKKRKSIAFISQWRPPDVVSKIKNSNVEVFYQTAEIILPKLLQYSVENNLKLEIFGSEWDPREKIYYQKILKSKNWIFKKRKKNNYSYYNTDQMEFIVFIYSSLGFESLARGNKTVSFYFSKKSVFNRKFKNFGFNFLNDKGNLWTNENNKKEFYRLMNYAKNTTIRDWKKDNQETIKKIMEIDIDNTKFKKLIS